MLSDMVLSDSEMAILKEFCELCVNFAGFGHGCLRKSEVCKNGSCWKLSPEVSSDTIKSILKSVLSYPYN